MDDFDPYYIWLGIPPEEQPADHYRLLGIRRFEQNPDVIANAAEGKMAYLRTLQVGKRSKQSQVLLNEIAAAHVCLLNANTRAAYDARLRAADPARAPAPAPASVLPPAPQPVQPLSPQPMVSAPMPVPVVYPPAAPLHAPPPMPLATVRPVEVASPPYVFNSHAQPKAFPTGEPAGLWEQIQTRLETLPRAAVIALGVGPVVVALLVLIGVIVATSGNPQPAGSRRLAENLSLSKPANYSSEPPRIVPPRPRPMPAPTEPTSLPPRIVGPSMPPSPSGRLSPGVMPGPPPQLRIDAAGAQIHRAILSDHGDYLAIDATDNGQRRVQVFHVQLGRKLLMVECPALLGRMDLIGDLILVATEPQAIAAFEAASGRLRTLQGIKGNIQDVALSPDSQWAFVLTDSELLLFDTATFEPHGNLLVNVRQHGYKQLFTQPNLVMAVGDKGLEAVQVDARRRAALLQLSPARTWRAFLPDDLSFFRFHEMNGAVHYERHGLHGRGRFAGAQLPPGAPPVSEIVKSEQGGNLIAWHGPGKELALFHLLQARPVGRIVPEESALSNIALSGDGQRFAAREAGGPLLVYSVPPLMRGPIGFAWPSQQQLQREGNRSAVTASASVSGPAVKNLRVDRVAGSDP